MCGVCLFLAITLEWKLDIKKIDTIYSVYVPVAFSPQVCSSFIAVKFSKFCYEAISHCIIIQSTKVQLKLLIMF